MSFTVLLIEDEETDRQLATAALHREFGSINTLNAKTISEAKLAMLSNQIDVIVLDLTLPDSVALDGLHEIRRHNSTVPIVVYTGGTEDGLTSQAIIHGATQFLRKTPNHSALPIAVAQAVQIGRNSQLDRRFLESQFQVLKTAATDGAKERRQIKSDLHKVKTTLEGNGQPGIVEVTAIHQQRWGKLIYWWDTVLSYGKWIIGLFIVGAIGLLFTWLGGWLQ